MTRNDEVPQEVGEAIDSLLAAERTLVRAEEKVGPYYAGARLLHDEMFAQETARDALETVIRDYITTLRIKLEAAEGEVARLREDARRAQTALMAIQQRTQCTSYGMGADVAQIADAALQEHTP